MQKTIWVSMLLSLISFGALADDSLEEVMVTGVRAQGQHLPATSLKRQADFLLLKVEVSNDSRDYKTRREEIYATLRIMQTAAAKDKSIELSVVRENNVVLPLKLDDSTLDFTNSGRGETLQTTISIKTHIGPGPGNATLLIAKLKNFISDIKPIGRSELNDNEGAQVSVVNIAQYRDPVIQLFANDVKKITTALGGDYRVVVRGLDYPIQWVRDGALGVTIFIPYEYDVVPTTISSYSARQSSARSSVVED